MFNTPTRLTYLVSVLVSIFFDRVTGTGGAGRITGSTDFVVLMKFKLLNIELKEVEFVATWYVVCTEDEGSNLHSLELSLHTYCVLNISV